MLEDDALAIIEIQQLLYQYCRAVDRGERAGLGAVYHPGAIDNHGAFNGPAEDFPDWLIPVMDAVNLIGQHHITNMLIRVSGQTAAGESYFLAIHPDVVPASGAMGLATAGGRYLDRFAKRDGAWKITERRVIFDFSFAPETRKSWSSEEDYPRGGRRENDPSWGFLPY